MARTPLRIPSRDRSSKPATSPLPLASAPAVAPVPPPPAPAKRCWDPRIDVLYVDILGLVDDLEAGKCWGIGWCRKLEAFVHFMTRVEGWPDEAARADCERRARVFIAAADKQEFELCGPTEA
jgi:hypothetical protein